MSNAKLFELSIQYAAELFTEYIFRLIKASKENDKTPFLKFTYEIGKTANEAAFLASSSANYVTLFSLVKVTMDKIEVLGEDGAKATLIENFKNCYEKSDIQYQEINN